MFVLKSDIIFVNKKQGNIAPPFGSNQLSLFSFKDVMTNSLNSLDILGLQYERRKNEDQKSHAKRRALKPRT
jgi:hypothetical protein